MAATLKGTVVSLLLFLLSSISQGVHGVEVLHLESVRAVEGQNITLPCLLGEKEGRKPVISQVEWRKKGELEDHKLVVYNPSFGETLIWPNVALDVVWYKDKDKLMGTSLVLKGVEARDSGRYICDITTYPNGSIRKVTRLRVEGPADTVTPSTNVTESTGTSTNVTESTGTSTNVTESTGTGTNVTESTGTSTNVTESTGTSTNVTESTGTSTNVTSELTEPGEMTTPIANLSVTPDTLTSSTVQEVNTEARPKGSEVNSSTDSPVRVPSTAQSGSTYPPKVQSDQPTTWSVQSDGRQGNESESETPSGGGQGGSVSPTLNPEKSTLAGEKEDHTLGTYYTSTASHGDDVVIETGPSSGQRYVVVWVLLPVLVLLIVVGFLYRRYIIQKKMDLPPPFKPPPPPVKYSSLRADDVPMTDILT